MSAQELRSKLKVVASPLETSARDSRLAYARAALSEGAFAAEREKAKWLAPAEVLKMAIEGRAHAVQASR
jgi:hypothetical protein